MYEITVIDARSWAKRRAADSAFARGTKLHENWRRQWARTGTINVMVLTTNGDGRACVLITDGTVKGGEGANKRVAGAGKKRYLKTSRVVESRGRARARAIGAAATSL